MKKIKFLMGCAFLVFLLPQIAPAQSSILDKFKQKVKDRVGQKIDQGTDKGLDKAEEQAKAGVEKKVGNNSKNEITSADKSTENKLPTGRDVKSFSRYDFVAGDKIVYAEDFAQDVVGEFPLQWSTNNRGEVVMLEGQTGKWLRMYHTSHLVSPYIKGLSENYTIEFDMILTFPNDGYVYPDMKIKLFQALSGDPNAKKYLQEFSSTSDMNITIHPAEEGNSTIMLESTKNSQTNFKNDQKYLKKFDSYYGRPFHVAIWVQKQRMRMWIEGEKIYDIPQVIPPGAAFNRMDVEFTSSFNEPDQIGIFVSNIRFADGIADMRSKLITEGKFVTSGILFDVNSDKIKPESYGLLKEMAAVLKENQAIKIKVVGHTDSDGDAAKNLDLSKKRAVSVAKALTSEFGVDIARMETDGKGESLPVDDNNTVEGKAKNRRVEFLKL